MKNLLLVCVIALAGCCTLNEDYVRQDRKDFDTFAPRVEKMINETTLYDEDQKQDMRDRLKGRDARITLAEDFIKEAADSE